MNPEDLDQALDELFEGRLREDALAALNRELRERPEAREAYREHQLLHHCLRYRSKGTDLTKVVPMDAIIRRRQRKAMRHALMASAAVLALGMLVLMLIMARSPDPAVSYRHTPGAEFSISHAPEADEIPEGRGMEPGSSMELASGCVELEFRSGIKAVIQGPAHLTLEREDLLRLDQGVAWFDVPAGAVGFQVITPNLVLTDLGTRFGVLSRPGGRDEVHVFQGRVRVLNRGVAKAEEDLGAGKARSAHPEGHWQEVELNPAPFLSELPAGRSAPVQVVGTATFTSSPDNEMIRGPYLFRALSELRAFRAGGADKLVVTLSHENGRIEEVTYEGLRLELAAQASSGPRTTAIYCLDAPPATGDLEIRTSGRCNGMGGSIVALANAHRGKPVAVSTGASASTSLEVRCSNAMVIASLVTNQASAAERNLAAKPLTPLFAGPCGSSSGASAYGLVTKPQRLSVAFAAKGQDPAIAVAVFAPSP